LFDQLPNGWQGIRSYWHLPVIKWLGSSEQNRDSELSGRRVDRGFSPFCHGRAPPAGTVNYGWKDQLLFVRTPVLLESKQYASGSGRVWYLYRYRHYPSSHDRSKTFNVGAPSIRRFSLWRVEPTWSGHPYYVFIVHVTTFSTLDGIRFYYYCDNEGGDAFQFLNAATVFNRLFPVRPVRCDRSLEIEGGSVSVIGLDSNTTRLPAFMSVSAMLQSPYTARRSNQTLAF